MQPQPYSTNGQWQLQTRMDTINSRITHTAELLINGCFHHFDRELWYCNIVRCAVCFTSAESDHVFIVARDAYASTRYICLRCMSAITKEAVVLANEREQHRPDLIRRVADANVDTFDSVQTKYTACEQCYSITIGCHHNNIVNLCWHCFRVAVWKRRTLIYYALSSTMIDDIRYHCLRLYLHITQRNLSSLVKW